MSIIGKLETYIDDEQECFIGVLVAFGKEMKIRITPSGLENPRAPTHLITLVGKSFEPQVGSAWLKQPKKPGSKITEFLSLMFDDSNFPEPLNVAAFPKGNGEWDISWRRRQATA
jgi:uncharacterized protein (DUF736 family)